MCKQINEFQAKGSPSKIDQWCKPKPAAKLVLAVVRRSPLTLKERAGGSMILIMSKSSLVGDGDLQILSTQNRPCCFSHLSILLGEKTRKISLDEEKKSKKMGHLQKPVFNVDELTVGVARHKKQLIFLKNLKSIKI